MEEEEPPPSWITLPIGPQQVELVDLEDGVGGGGGPQQVEQEEEEEEGGFLCVRGKRMKHHLLSPPF